MYEADVTSQCSGADFRQAPGSRSQEGGKASVHLDHPAFQCCNTTVFRLHAGISSCASTAVGPAPSTSVCVQVVCSDATALRLAKLEIELMNKRIHPGIMPLLDSGTEQSAPPHCRQILYMLMPLYSGGSLWDVVHAQSQPLSNAQILSILEQVRHGEGALRCCSSAHAM